jgi:membrane fusion protein (multidrug efflux system)
MKKLHAVVAVVGLLSASALAYWWQHRSVNSPATAADAPTGERARPPAGGGGGAGPVPVEVARAESRLVQDDATAVGSLRSRQGVMVRPEVSGRVARLGFADGQRVKRGQVLVQLDDTLQVAQLQQAEAQASIARSNYQRNKELVAQNFVSRSVLDQSEANLQVAEAQVSLARAQLGRMKIVAPFDGTAGIRNVNVGDYVKDGADLVTLEDTSSMYVDFRLPERFLPKVQSKQKVSVAVDALPDRQFDARVEALDPQVDANGRALLVRARVDNAGQLLRPGMFARVRLVLAEKPDAVLVPEEALVPQGNKQFLLKVVQGPEGPASERLEVSTGIRRDGKVEILSGVAAGDTVVTAGQAQLMRGQSRPVRVVQLGRAGGGGGSAAGEPQRPKGGASGGAPAQPAASAVAG